MAVVKSVVCLGSNLIFFSEDCKIYINDTTLLYYSGPSMYLATATGISKTKMTEHS